MMRLLVFAVLLGCAPAPAPTTPAPKSRPAEPTATGPVTLLAIDRPRALAVADGMLFASSLDGGVYRVKTTGGAVEKLTSAKRPTYIAVADRYLYFTDVGVNGDDGRVGRLSLETGKETILARKLERPIGCAVASGRAYFSLAHSVESVGDDGQRSFQQVHPDPYFVVTNGDRVCWAYGGYSIGCSTVDGKELPMLAGADFGEPQLRGLVLDKGAAYYLLDTGKLVAVPFDSANVQLSRPSPACDVGDVALDDKDVYWACDGRLSKVGKRGGEVRTLHKDSGKIVGLAVDATHVYLATWPENVVKKLPK